MARRSPEQIWKEYFAAAVDICVRHGLTAAIDYLVGEKLVVFAPTCENSSEFLAELPAFSKKESGPNRVLAA